MADAWLSRRGAMFGCSICHAAATQTDKRDKFATYSVTVLKKWNVLRHQKSTLHQQSCAIATGCQLVRNTKAPSAEEFERLWEHRCAGGSLDVRMEGISAQTQGSRGSQKMKSMQWCIAEAKRTRFRSFLRTAVSATLTQDARQQNDGAADS